MYVRNATLNQIQYALNAVNEQYGDNIITRDTIERRGKDYMFTLRVKSSRGLGHGRRLSYNGQSHRIATACWHVYGNFFEELFKVAPNAMVRVAGNRKITVEAGNWEDWLVGSEAHPYYASEACDCGLDEKEIRERENPVPENVIFLNDHRKVC